MGPFPHDAPPPKISDDNPMGTDGFEFVEFCHPQPDELDAPVPDDGFFRGGQAPRQAGDALSPGRHQFHPECRAEFVRGEFCRRRRTVGAGDGVPRRRCAPCLSSRAVAWAQSRSQTSVGPGELNIPAIEGIGGLQIYLVDRYGAKGSIYDVDFEWLAEPDPKPAGAGLFYIDHLTHNVHRGRLDEWAEFYVRLFNFRQIRFFDIEGRVSGLHSRAMTSPDGKIRIPINEDAGSKGQIQEYLDVYKGEGIQHVALGAKDLYKSIETLAARGVEFMPAPNDVYYSTHRPAAAEARRAGRPAASGTAS